MTLLSLGSSQIFWWLLSSFLFCLHQSVNVLCFRWRVNSLFITPAFWVESSKLSNVGALSPLTIEADVVLRRHDTMVRSVIPPLFSVALMPRIVRFVQYDRRLSSARVQSPALSRCCFSPLFSCKTVASPMLVVYVVRQSIERFEKLLVVLPMMLTISLNSTFNRRTRSILDTQSTYWAVVHCWWPADLVSWIWLVQPLSVVLSATAPALKPLYFLWLCL